jgi:hypothetical protein
MSGYRDLVTIGVQMLGTTTGNVQVETPEFYFTVQICFGCLTSCTPDTAAEGGEACTNPEPPDELPCWTGQDEAVDCRICAALPQYDENVCRAFCAY